MSCINKFSQVKYSISYIQMEKPSLNKEKNYNSIKTSDTGCWPVECNFIDYFILEYGEASDFYFFSKIHINEGLPITWQYTNVLLHLLL